MLVLNRKVGESVKIANDIEVKVVAIEGGQIKLGIEAPRDVDIHRQEVYEAIQRENAEASILNKSMIDLIKNPKNE
ncbi:carbon storage regulator CsrA [Salimicrobium halophilum]|uniref:Translational regulator CsrA n=1 Tax=Salimicrobium halophilum TaxID=86666 RepID=A0A1G8S0V7_9BACI|nr:carbon storage regulator CsrA [Salimicrobium halophilum]SDJ22290.1 carbon storage regulator, CsrA [Salimicrobium halophilum]